MLTHFSGKGGLVKTCFTNPSHHVKLTSRDIDNEIVHIEILIGTESPVWALWDFVDKTVKICKKALLTSKKDYTELPWFEPDISNYPKLVDKIKTYILFS